MIEVQELERKLFQSYCSFKLDNKVTIYTLWKDRFELVVLPSSKVKSTKNGYLFRGNAIQKYFSGMPVADITHNSYQSLNDYGKKSY